MNDRPRRSESVRIISIDKGKITILDRPIKLINRNEINNDRPMESDQLKRSDQIKKSRDQLKKSQDQLKKSRDQLKKSQDQLKKSKDQLKKSQDQLKKSSDQLKKLDQLNEDKDVKDELAHDKEMGIKVSRDLNGPCLADESVDQKANQPNRRAIPSEKDCTTKILSGQWRDAKEISGKIRNENDLFAFLLSELSTDSKEI